MNEENRRKIWKLIQEAGLYLLGQLPSHPNHPKGRNPYAHVALCVKENFETLIKIYLTNNLMKLLNILNF